MGDAEDTFTKQAIQAGYVTSGRDVLLKQEQMAKSAGARRRVGGGGPSSTGRASANPVFPPPTYDAPPRQSTALVNAPGAFPQIGNPSLNRSASASVTGFSSVAAGTLSPSAAATGGGKPSGPARSASMSASTSSASTPATAVVTGLPTAGTKGGKKKAQKAKGNGPKSSANAARAAAAPATAASVVAGLRTTKSKAAQPSPAHATLTPLIPLNKKGGGSKSAAISVGGGKSVNTATSGNSSKGHNRNDSLPPDTVTLPSGVSASASRKHGAKLGALKTSGDLRVAGSIPAATTSFGGVNGNSMAPGAGAIGGTVLGGGAQAQAPLGHPIGPAIGPPGGLGSAVGGGLGAIGGGSLLGSGGGGLGSIGGAPLGGQPLGGQPLGMPLREGSAIGPSSNGTTPMGGALFPPVGGGKAIGPSGGNAPGSGVIGGGTIGSNPFASNAAHSNSGSSALASMLGIQLPTGSGSLREAPSLRGSSSAAPIPSSAPAPIPIGGPSNSGPGAIGGLAKAPGAPSGGLIIGGGGGMSSTNAGGVPIGGYHGNGTSSTAVGNNSNDIALLQSLLPGVRVTSGSNSNQASIGSGSIGGAIIGGGASGSTDWGTSIGGPPQQQLGGLRTTQSSIPIGGLGSGLQQQPSHQLQQGLGGGDTWGSSGLYGGTIGGNQTSQQQQQQQQQRSNIW